MCSPAWSQDEVADGDWMQMAWLLRYECRDLFIETLLVLRAKARAFDLGWTTPKSLRKKTTASLKPARPTAARHTRGPRV
jgi:hypothetical protein